MCVNLTTASLVPAVIDRRYIGIGACKVSAYGLALVATVCRRRGLESGHFEKRSLGIFVRHGVV
jgi:hypothetical protein